ncbi:MAG TPA: hypothetical protein VG826_34295 [Pirellulales bacterium]|nr:hypothetical protein [Pirellulales bacterium]
MGFFAGRVSFDRFRVESPDLRKLSEKHVELLSQFSVAHAGAPSLGETKVGFTAGGHLLDADFGLEKNVFGDVLHCGVRIDTTKVPAALRKAWLLMEIQALTADNPGRRLTKAERQQVNEAVEQRAQDESGDGRFRRMQHVSILWDVRQRFLYLGGGGPVATEQCLDLLSRAFELSVQWLTAGRLAHAWCLENDRTASWEALAPAVFHDAASGAIAWVNDLSANFDFLGNEFLLWLWWHLEAESDTISLADGSEVVGMLNRTLSLECPEALSGKETITAESPVRLPEAMHAIGAGKLPRKSGLVLARQDHQHDLVIQAETFSVSGAKSQLSSGDDAEKPGGREERMDALRHLVETLDLLFAAFCQRRFGKPWKRDVEEIRRWLQKKASPPKRSAA